MLKNSKDNFAIYKKGILHPESLDDLNRVERETGSGASHRSRFDLRNMPKVILGEFDILQILPQEVGVAGSEKNELYFVVQFPMNIYPDDHFVDDVRFAVNFRVEEDSGVKVLDLYPREKIEELKRNVNLAISPSLTFSEFSAKFVDISFNFTYDEIRPVIYGSGVGLPHAYWNMRNSFSHYIAGAKVMHALIKVPNGTQKLMVDAELQAALRINNKVVNSVFAFFGVEDDLVTDKLSIEFNLRKQKVARKSGMKKK